ncbi:MAG: two-component regulator propeller domain-containing protein [Acidobacteriota bacterium]
MLIGAHLKRFTFRQFASFVCFALLLFFTSISKAERLPVKTYSVADGLLRDSVARIKSDSRGFLWFCTSEGISRFDGYGFTNFTVRDGLPDRRINDFLEMRNGTILLATDGGLAKLNPAGIAESSENPLFTTILPENPRAKPISVLFEDKAGNIFAGTRDGFYKLNEDGGLEAVNLGKPPNGMEMLTVTAIIQDRRGAFWIGLLGGLVRLLPNGETERFTTENGLPDVNIAALHEDKNGRIWVGLRPNLASGLLLLVPEPEKNKNIVERHFTTKNGLPADWITDLFETADGQFLVGTIRGLCLWQGVENSVCKNYTSANNLCDSEIWSISEDKDKNIWLGTRCGLKKWMRSGFTAFVDENGTVAKSADSIFENPAGDLFASFNDGDIRTVSRFDGEKFNFVRPHFPSDIKYFGFGNRQTVRQDAAGDWWFPTADCLYRFSDAKTYWDLAKITPQKICPNSERTQVIRLFEDSHGNLWISTLKSIDQKLIYELWVWRRDVNKWRNLSADASIGDKRLAVSFAEDKSDNIWIATYSEQDETGLIRYDRGRFDIFTKAENGMITSNLISLFVDDKNRLWIGTNDGLLRLDDVNAGQLNFKRYSPNEGLSSSAVSCVTEDEFGRFYIGTGRGLDRLNVETRQVENFTTNDGLPSSFVDLCYRDRKNNLWFGTTDGLARFVPEPERGRVPPNILITGLNISGVPQAVSVLGESEIAPLELDSDQRQITVNFLGLGANLGEKLKYEYRFADADWTATNERTVNFSNLSAGEYKFEVRAQTADRIFSISPAAVSFKIAAPIWQRSWFLLLSVLLIGFLVYLIYKYRLRQLLELEKVRTRIATDLHDDIGANLTRISLLSEVAKQKSDNGNGAMLTSIADIARESVASMNDIVWAISPDHDSLLDLTRRMRRHAEEVFAMRDIDLKFKSTDAALKLSVGVRRDVLLIFKEAVNNAAKHADCSQVVIDFNCQNSVLSLQIEDNGKGFETNAENDGQGLRSMTRRADSLGGNLTIDSNDGTTVKFELLLSKATRV